MSSVISNYFYGSNPPNYDNGMFCFNNIKNYHYCCFKMNNVNYIVLVGDNGQVIFSSLKCRYNVDEIISHQFNNLLTKRNLSKCLSKFEICLTLLFKIIKNQNLKFDELLFICPDRHITNSYKTELFNKNHIKSIESNGYCFHSIINYNHNETIYFVKC
ncbi:hypothetical protein PBI_SCTP2_159 [Salicola phage SCTP-2]|nr:hypothetical protein PBI_SCTP2_159 [Salicola phage SCTP-2]